MEHINTIIKETGEFVKLIARRIRLIRLNQNFLVFLVFLAISSGFWFMLTLKETTTASKDYTLKIVGVPKDVIFTTDIPDKIKVNISGRGYNFLSYMSKNDEHIITVNYEDLEYTSTKVTIDNTTLRRSLAKCLGSGLKVVSLTPAQIDAYYTTGKAKKVPIKFNGKVTTELQHVLCGIELLTDSVQVYAPLHLHDSVKVVHTEKLVLDELSDTTIVRVALKKIDGTKFTPDSVDVKICVDLFSERTFKVEIFSINCPNSQIIRTFPRLADVSFRVNASMFNEIKKEDFVVAVDYKKIKPNSKSCPVELVDKPDCVSQVRIHPEQVDVLIEQVEY